jgi:hypothetical protein
MTSGRYGSRCPPLKSRSRSRDGSTLSSRLPSALRSGSLPQAPVSTGPCKPYLPKPSTATLPSALTDGAVHARLALRHGPRRNPCSPQDISKHLDCTGHGWAFGQALRGIVPARIVSVAARSARWLSFTNPFGTLRRSPALTVGAVHLGWVMSDGGRRLGSRGGRNGADRGRC